MLVAPLSLTVMAAGAAAFAMPVALLAYWGRYTTHTTLAGELVPDRGLVQVRSPRAANVEQAFGVEGQDVGAGEVLFVLSSARERLGLPAAEASIGAELARRERSLLVEQNRKHALDARALQTQDALISALTVDRAHLRALLDIAHARLELAVASERRYAELADAGLASNEDRERKANERIAAEAAREELVREQARVAHELAEQQAQRERLPLEQQDAAAALERALVATRLERIENTVRERVAVVAPVSGTLTAVLAEQGQSVAADEALVSIVPAGARLEAHLYAPSSAIGLIRVGDSVELRYAAFPYRRFGTFRGTVRAISGSALPLETVAPLGVDILGSAGALYRVTVALPSQSVMYRNERYALRAGMRIEGEVMRETYRFYEWALAPLRTRPAPHTASR